MYYKCVSVYVYGLTSIYHPPCKIDPEIPHPKRKVSFQPPTYDRVRLVGDSVGCGWCVCLLGQFLHVIAIQVEINFTK